MGPKFWLLLIVTAISACCALSWKALAQSNYVPPHTIDEESWSNVRHSDFCAVHVLSAVAYYWEDPKFRKERDVYAYSYFVNETQNCWIELYVQGISGESILLKMSPDGDVIDASMQNHFEPRFTPYPKGYIHLE